MIPLNEHAYLHLQNLIITNQLSYQQIYSETKLSKELGISRTPLRDAVHRLAQEGYIDIIPSKGFMLHQLTKKDVEETFQIRSALESYCTLHIAKNNQTEKAQKLFRELHWIMDTLKEIIDTSHSIEVFSDYDFQFHTKIIEFLENEQFSSIFATFIYRMTMLARLSLAHDGRMEATYKEHLEILTAMENGDVENVYEITLNHMNNPKRMNLDDLK